MQGPLLIDRYVARRIAVPLVGTLLLSFLLLVIEELTRLMSVVANTGAPVRLLWRMLAYLLPEYFGLAIPLALLLGVLLAFRNLALSEELDVLRGIGLGFERLLRVAYVYTFALMAVSLLILGFIEPIASYRYERIGSEFDNGAVGASIQVGEFNALGHNVTLRIDRSERKGNELRGIFLSMNDATGGSIAVTAASGRFLRLDDAQQILLRLHKGRLVQISPKFSSPRTLTFESYDLPIPVPAIGDFRTRGSDVSELTLPELLYRSVSKQATSSARRAAWADFNARLAKVAIMVMLPLLAVALAVPPKRSQSAIGVLLGIMIIVAFQKIERYAVQLSVGVTWEPVLAVWVPFGVFSVAILRMYWVISRVPGGQPIGAIERARNRSAQLARKFLLPSGGSSAP